MSNWKVRSKFFDSGKVIVYPVTETTKEVGHASESFESFDEWTDVFAARSEAEKYHEGCVKEGAKKGTE